MLDFVAFFVGVGLMETSSTVGTSSTDFDDASSTGRGFAFYDPQPVEVSISLPKKPPVLKLREAKMRQQLKAWGLRKK